MEPVINHLKENATVYIAAYGAIVATAVLLWDFAKYRRDRPRIEVKATIRILAGGFGKPQSKIGIDIINHGRRPITIVASGFELLSQPGYVVTALDPGLPNQIGEGQAHTSFVDYDAISFTDIKYAWARDATGRKYLSKKRPLMP